MLFPSQVLVSRGLGIKAEKNACHLLVLVDPKGDEASTWYTDKDGINLPKCPQCWSELTYDKVPKQECSRNFGGRIGLTPRQAIKLKG